MDVFSFFFVSEAIESENSHGNHHISKRRIIFLKVFCLCFFVCFSRVSHVCMCVCADWTRWPQFASNNWVINCRLTQCVLSADKRYTHPLSWQTTDWALLNYRNYWFALSAGTSDRARFIFKWLHLFRFSLSTPQ